MKTLHGWLVIGLGFALVGCNDAVDVAIAAVPVEPTAREYPTYDGTNAATGEVVFAAPLRKGVQDVGSGPLDVVLLNKDKDRVYILLNTGTGLDTRVTQEIDAIVDPVSAAAFDANDDGALDLVIASAGPQPTLQIWMNNGSGVFAEEAGARTLLPGAPTAVFAAQFDDVCHNPDDWLQGARTDYAAVVNVGGASRIIVFRAAGGTRFLPHTIDLDRGSTGTGTIDDDIDSGDVDGDKDIDIVVASGTARGGGVRVLLNQASQGEFRFEAGSMMPLVGPKGPLAATSIHLARLDGGLAPDLLISTKGTPGLLVALNGGGFGASWRGFEGPWSDDPNRPAASTLAVGELFLGGPGALTADVIALPQDVVSAYARAKVFDNDTDLASSPVKLKYKAPEELIVKQAGYRAAVLADVNNDGKPDLLLPDGYHLHQ